MSRIWLVFLVIIGCLLFINMQCNESLPPYERPAHVFGLDLGCAFPDPSRVVLNIPQQILGHKKIYFDLVLKSIFDETISDSSQTMLGEILLWWNDDPNVTATIPIYCTDEISGYVFVYHPSVTIDPGDSACFAVWWQYCLGNDGKYIWENVSKTWQSEDASYIYTNYGPMEFSVQAKMQPFPKGPAIYSNVYKISITFQYDRKK